MQKNKIIPFFCFIIVSNLLYSQDWNKIQLYQTDAETFMFDKQFDKAAETFKKASKLAPENANFKFKIGYCYLRTDDKKKDAISFLEDASKNVTPEYKEKSLKEPKAPTLALYLLAEAYRINQQFDEAAEAYTKYKEFLKPNDNLRVLVDQNIASCKNANELIRDSVSVKCTNLGNVINNDLPNINAVLSGDGKTLAFTTINKLGNDIFISNKVNNVWLTPKKITNQLGNKYLLTCYLSFNGKDLYLVSDDPENSEIFVTTIEGNKWIQPLQFEKPINSKSNETHACLTKDGNTIYFTSDRKGGIGGLDIYKATVNEKGLWGDPVNLGSEINTSFNEVTPFLSSDEKYLFFSSEGHGGLGGYDIFYVNLEGSQKVKAMNYPINNSDNNVFFFPENGLKSGIVSLYNSNSLGKRDIYHYDISRLINLNGTIFAESNEGNVPFKVKILDVSNNDTVAKIDSRGGNFSYRIGTGNYRVIINNNKYLPFSKELNVTDDLNSNELRLEAKMIPIPVEKPKLVAETLAVKKDTVIVPVIVAEAPKKEVKKDIQKPKEVKKPEEVKKSIVPAVKIDNAATSNTDVKISTYAVQLMALKDLIDENYFKGIDNIEITQTPEGFYRYSVGSTESMEEAMATLSKVKALGYTKAYVRIDLFDATFAIQLMASKKQVDISTFNNIDNVRELKGDDGYYRYIAGDFASHSDAKNTLTSIRESGYSNAFIKKVRLK